MKSSTWIVVVLALAVTASMVVAKSFIASPKQADASAQMAAASTMLRAEQGSPSPASRAVAQIAPSRTGATIPPSPALVNQAPIIDPSKGTQQAAGGWSVLVVRGEDEENITYQSADAQVPTP